MKTSAKMTEILAAICRKYGGDPDDPVGLSMVLETQPWGRFCLQYAPAARGANIWGTVDCGFMLPRPGDPIADPILTFFRTPEGLVPYRFDTPLGAFAVSGHDGTHTLYRVLNHDQYEKFLEYAELKAGQLERVFLGKDAATVTVIEARRLVTLADALKTTQDEAAAAGEPIDEDGEDEPTR